MNLDIDNDTLAKMNSRDRQSFIIDNLSTLLVDKKYVNTEVSKIAKLILKAYLLEKGESIEVDFSSEEKVVDVEMWLSQLDRDIAEFPKYYDKMKDDTKEMSKKVQLDAERFIRMFMKDLSASSTNFSSRLRKCFSNNSMVDAQNEGSKINEEDIKFPSNTSILIDLVKNSSEMINSGKFLTPQEIAKKFNCTPGEAEWVARNYDEAESLCDRIRYHKLTESDLEKLLKNLESNLNKYTSLELLGDLLEDSNYWEVQVKNNGNELCDIAVSKHSNDIRATYDPQHKASTYINHIRAALNYYN